MKLLNKLLDLSGKTAIVTGGAGYLGQAIVEVLLELGSNVVVCSRNVENCKSFINEIKIDSKGSVYAMKVDISSINSIETLKKSISKEIGTIDILVNNASFGAGKDLLSMSEEQWKAGIDGTINGVFRMTKQFLPEMIEKRQGSIINISSMYGIVSPNVSIYEGNTFYNPPNYGCGKAAIIQFTRYIACVYGKYGIRCNSISPGPFPNKDVQKNHEFIERLTKKVPLNRIGKPVELKGVIALLASDASTYINGANIVVDGGWTSW